MASARKLQLEVDRTLKKIEEGLIEFDEMYDHVQAADGPAKQRLEGELKSEIKKLQKLRDQVKTWASSAEIKNKQQLVDAREKIERRMEAFKLVEREMKTKAYSKEGLARTQAMSEEERKRMKAREWVQDAVSRLGDEIEEMEKEAEAIAESGKGSKKEREVEAHLEAVIKTHKLHQDKLEALTRLIDNGNVKPEDVDGIQEDVNYYISQARRPDDSTFEADFGIYDSFELLSEEALEDQPEDDDDEATASAKASAAAATKSAAAGATNSTVPTSGSGSVGGGGATAPQSSQLPAINVKASTGNTATPIASSSSAATTPTNAATAGLKSTTSSGSVKASGSAASSSSSLSSTNASLIPPTSPLASSSNAASQRTATQAADSSKTPSIAGAPLIGGTRSAGSSFSAPSSAPSASSNPSSNVQPQSSKGPSVAASLSGPGVSALSSKTTSLPATSGNPSLATAASSSAKPPQPPQGVTASSSSSQGGGGGGVNVVQQLQSLSLGQGNQQQQRSGSVTASSSAQGGVGSNTPTSSSSANTTPRALSDSNNTNMATLLKGKDGTTLPAGGGLQGANAGAVSAVNVSANSATSTSSSSSRMASSGGAVGGGSSTGVNLSLSASASSSATTGAAQRSGSISSTSSIQTSATPSTTSSSTRGGGSTSLSSLSSSSSLTQQQQTATSSGSKDASIINSSSSNSTSSSSSKNDTFSMALAKASRSASMSLPEPILPNPWAPQTLSQLRFSASILSASLQHVPEGVDERPKPHTVKTVNPSTHPAFPTSPDYRLLDSPSAYERFSQDTLFFIFYHCQGGFQQYLAGRELKQRQGWKLHKSYRTWFKETDPHEPAAPDSASNSNGGAGAVYFDYDQEWAIVSSSIIPSTIELEDD